MFNNLKNNKSIGIHLYILWMFLVYVYIFFNNSLKIKSNELLYVALMLMLFHYFFLIKGKLICEELIYILLLIPAYLISNSHFISVLIVFSCLIMKYYPLSKIIKTSLYIQGLFITVYLLCFVFNLTHNTIFLKNGVVCHTLGFLHPNETALRMYDVLILLTFFFFTKYDNIKKFFLFIILSVFTYIISIVTGNRTFFYSLLVYGVLILISKFKSQKSFKFLMITSLFLLIGLICYLPQMENISEFDKILSGRLSILKIYFNEMNMNAFLFGRQLIQDMPFDNAFMMILFNGGIVYVIFFLSTYIKGIVNAPVHYANLYMPFIVSYLVTGFAENTFSSLTTSTIIFYRILYEYKNSIKGVRSGCVYVPNQVL